MCWEQWLITLHKFHMSKFIIQDLQTILCAQHPESSLLPLPYIWPRLYSFFSPHSSSTCNHHSVVYEFVYFLFFVYIPHMSEVMQFLSFSIWLISLNMILSRSIHVVSNGNISSFQWLSSIALCVCTTSLSIIPWKTLKLSVPMKQYNMERKHRH